MSRRVVYTYTTYSGGCQRSSNSCSSGFQSFSNSSTTSSSSSIDVKEFREECLKAHNEYRRKHGAPDVSISTSMNNFAQEWADRLLSANSMQHRPNNKYGENIYMASGMNVTGKTPVESWYNEIKDYSYNNPTFSGSTGHFTQVVWKNCSEIGIGVANRNGTTYVVCNYNPHGNVMGQFAQNVLKPGTQVQKTNPKHQIQAASAPSEGVDETDGQFNQFELTCLRSHNNYRAKHGCPPLKLNRNICNYAQEWANNLASRGVMQHRSNNRYGENLYASFGSGQCTDASVPVKAWYDEIRYYSYGSGFSSSTGHFTQVVWKNSKELGVGIATRNNQCYVVCNYDPPGNYQGQFSQNVPSPN